MKTIKFFGTLCLLAICVIIMYYCSSIFGSEFPIPHIMGVVFTLGYAVIASSGSSNGKERIMTTICTIAVSFALFAIATWMANDLVDFYNSQDWDGCESSPTLPICTWSWEVQIVISALIGWLTYKFGPQIGKGEEKKAPEPTGSRL